MRVVSISVNGLARAIDAGFFEWLKVQDADVVCIQDHRMCMADLDDPKYTPAGYDGFFVDAENPADGGVGIYTKMPPKAIIYGFGQAVSDREGRFIQADFDEVSLVSMMAPDALKHPERQTDKDDFMQGFMTHLQKTARKRRQYIFCAALQTVHQVTDASARYHRLEISGFLPHERVWMDTIIDQWGYGDALRLRNREAGQYTWWPLWAEGWRKQSGWRTDYQLLTPGIKNRVTDAWIDQETRFSDHAPLLADYGF